MKGPIKRWRNTSTDWWNARALEKGYHYAILPNPPIRRRVRMMLVGWIYNIRMWIATKVAPKGAIHEDFL